MKKPELVEVLREIAVIAKESSSLDNFSNRLQLRVDELMGEITEYNRIQREQMRAVGLLKNEAQP